MSGGYDLTVGQELRNLRFGLKRQLSVIMALIFKDWKIRLQTSKFGFFFVLLEPLVYVSVLSLIFFMAGTTTFAGVHVLLFGPVGVVAYLVFKRALMNAPKSIGKNEGLLDYPQIKPIDAFIASFILQLWLLFLASVLLIFLLWWFLDLAPAMPQPLEAIGVLAVYIVGCFGLGLFVSVYGTLYEFFDRVLDVLKRPIMLISGVVWPIDFLPPSVREVLAYNPLVHVISYLRHYTLGMPLLPEADMSYVFHIAVALLGLGFITYFPNRYRLVLER